VWHALHTARKPLLDLTLFRVAGFAAAAATVLLAGAAAFGVLLVLPLYLQVGRGASTLATGLLMAPQGIGAAIVMPISGRLADRVGGGRISVVGLLIVTAATIGMTTWTADTSYVVTSLNLFIRGVGLGFSMMPAMAAAYSTISREAVPRATTTLQVLLRVGASIGTALLAVVLESQVKAALPGLSAAAAGGGEPLPPAVRTAFATPLAHAFSNTFWWAAGLAAVSMIPATVLAVTAHAGARAAGPARVAA
jgi:predicted MFS family arabinose efflux permease